MKLTALILLHFLALAAAKQATRGRVTAKSGLNSRTCPDHKHPKLCPVVKAYPYGTVLDFFCETGSGSAVEGDTRWMSLASSNANTGKWEWVSLHYVDYSPYGDWVMGCD